MGKKIPPKLTSLVERTQYLSSLIDMTMDTLKRMYTDLRPGMLDLLGLTAAIGWQAGDFEKRTGIRCQVNFAPERSSSIPISPRPYSESSRKPLPTSPAMPRPLSSKSP